MINQSNGAFIMQLRRMFPGHDADECIKNLEIADKLIIEGILRDEKEKNLS